MGEEDISSEDKRGEKGGEKGKWRKRKEGIVCREGKYHEDDPVHTAERAGQKVLDLIPELCWKEADR